ncbi:hypothetical protein [Paenibacillus sp. NPDC058071]|uniref:hypothetical protein n=1 Tax=Paenibacillus sp. NPDC058071 TaxID=3346326 RepID=UPI0036D8CA63
MNEKDKQRRNRGIVFAALFALGLILLAPDHTGRSIGDYIFGALGIPVWTEGNRNGLHTPVITGIILIIFGLSGTTYYFSEKVPKLKRWLLLGGLAFLLISPLAIEQSLFVIKRGAQGVASVDFSPKKSGCSYSTSNGVVRADCNLTIYNYGKADSATVKLLYPFNTDLAFKPKEIGLFSHKKMNVNVQFIGQMPEGSGFSGFSNDVPIELEMDGVVKRYH